MGFNGDTWTGNIVATDDGTREMTLVYNGKDGTETFVGVLQSGYKIKLKDGTQLDVKPSMFRTGTHVTVYYMPKLHGLRKKYYEIFNIVTLPN